MDAILVFIDGTICDTRHRHYLFGSSDFYAEETISADLPIPGSVTCLTELAKKYVIIYIGARPASCLEATKNWLIAAGFPVGAVYLATSLEERLQIVRGLKIKSKIVAGIGDRWDDNELHLEIGCLSIILKEWEGNWDTVRKYVP